jgi:myo-inositol 2-dehydrogenase/D-chiro-inositol 1-dehydrogenase
MDHRSDRRRFLLGSAAAAASSGLTAAPAEEIRTGSIGVGVRGSGLLRETLAQKDVRVTAICDIDPANRDKALSAASKHNPRSFTEWRKLLDLKDLDAVFIATPCDLHSEMAAAFLEAGKYVYCEKPLGITPEQVDHVVKAARRSKTFLQIGQQLRYYPTVREAIRQIHEGNLVGKRYIIKAHRHGGRSAPRSGGAQESVQQRKRREWYADVKRSGDLIVENAVHNIDACNWIADSRPVSGYGHGKKYFPQPIPAGTVMMDGFSVEYIYANDMHCDYSQISFHPRTMKQLPGGMWYAVFGEKGSVFMTHEEATFYDLYGRAEPLDMLASLKGGKFNPNYNAVLEFVTCIREKREPFASLQVGAVAALTAIMGRESIYKGRSITWKELGVSL